MRWNFHRPHVTGFWSADWSLTEGCIIEHRGEWLRSPIPASIKYFFSWSYKDLNLASSEGIHVWALWLYISRSSKPCRVFPAQSTLQVIGWNTDQCILMAGKSPCCQNKIAWMWEWGNWVCFINCIIYGLPKGSGVKSGEAGGVQASTACFKGNVLLS